MMNGGQLRPGVLAEQLREEFDLSQDVHRHVAWLCNNGMLNADGLRTMLSRQRNIDAYGIDAKTLPPLAASPKPRARRAPMAHAPPVASHRGMGALPAPAPARRGDDAVVIDWGLRRRAETPPQTPPRRARTTSPEALRFGDIPGILRRQPLVRAILDDSPGFADLQIMPTESTEIVEATEADFAKATQAEIANPTQERSFRDVHDRYLDKTFMVATECLCQREKCVVVGR